MLPFRSQNQRLADTYFNLPNRLEGRHAHAVPFKRTCIGLQTSTLDVALLSVNLVKARQAFGL